MNFKCLFLSFMCCSIIVFAQNTPEQDVSTMNGELVKVGERHQYEYSYKPYNISIDPIGLIVGNMYVSGSYAFHSNAAVKLDIGYVYKPYGRKVKGLSVTASVPVFFKKLYTGLFLEPGLSLYSLTDTEADSNSLTESKKSTAFGPQMLVGWGWYWDSGLNISIAGGVQRNFSNKEDDELTKNLKNFNEFRAVGYFRTGWAF